MKKMYVLLVVVLVVVFSSCISTRSGCAVTSGLVGYR